MEQFRVAGSNVNVLAIGHRFTNDCKTRSYVQQYAISKTRSLSAMVRTRRESGMTGQQEGPKHSFQLSWRVRFKKQLDDQWLITELIDEH
ncbi:hypothetical protein V1506DRAFT_543269 [Lipomyces tetrasporus]